MAVFVGNLPFDVTEDALISFFTEQIGPVEAVRVVRDKETGAGKGFAFVNFKQDSSVSLALSMETIKMDKRDLRITKVMKKGHLTKIQSAKKKSADSKKNQREITGKLHKFKFSTKKKRTTEQNDRRALKKSAKKAIKKKKAAKQGRLMA
uniref:RRM domain-containing protein n=1 Tax=Caenorhabditis tropicalis TaxID=1561998 RepID=A0A1I7T0M9_9PELO